jgi:hypothetical protein
VEIKSTFRHKNKSKPSYMKKTLLTRYLMVLWLSCGALLAAQMTASAQTLTHRYEFWNDNGDTNAVDAIGAANGQFLGDLAGTTISAGQLRLDGGGYVLLPKGIITNDQAVTIEAWGDFPPLSEQGTWANLFDFGTPSVADLPGKADSHSISFCVNTGNPSGDLDAAISDFDDANVNRQNCYASADLLANTTGSYVTAVFNPPGGYIALYVNGNLQSKISITNTITPGVDDNTNWIGWDNWPDPSLTANIDEFRIWNGALTGLEVAASAANGFAALNTNAGTVLTLQLTAGSQLAIGAQEPATVLATASLITNTVDVTSLATFASGNTNILQVSSTGEILGVALGTTSVIASYAGLSSTNMVSIVEPAAVLTHRISFSEPVSSSNTVADTVGTLYATLEGTAVQSNGMVVLDGSAGCYVDLSSNSFANDGIISGYSSATVDFWGTFTSLTANWEYGWSFGNDPANYGQNFIYFSVHAGGTDHYINTATTGGSAAVDMNGDFANEAVHCTSIIDPTTGTLAVYTNGVLSGYVTGDSSVPPLNTIATNFIFFGRSLWTSVGPPYAGDPFLSAGSSFQEIRVYKGSLSPQQVAVADQSGPNNTNINPGTLKSLTLQAPSQVQWLQDVPLKLLVNYSVLSNWDLIANSLGTPQGLSITSSDTNVLGVSGVQVQALALGSATLKVSYEGITNTALITVVRPPAAVLSHRYNFDSADGDTNAVDLVGGADGTFLGDLSGTSITGGELVLDGGGYVQLPAGIVTNDLAVTVEAWGDYPPVASQNLWGNLFDFGTQDATGADSYSISFCVDTGAYLAPIHSLDAAISDFDNANVNRQGCYAPSTLVAGNSNQYIAAVYNPAGNYIAFYVNGVIEAQIAITSTITPGVQDLDNWIGWDNWNDPKMIANLHEFRIWNGALSPDEIAADEALGPDKLPSNNNVTLSASLSSGHIVVTWPTAASTNFSLYSSSSLGTNAVWSPVGVTPTVVGQNNQVTVTASGSAQFFRLEK